MAGCARRGLAVATAISAMLLMAAGGTALAAHDVARPDGSPAARGVFGAAASGPAGARGWLASVSCPAPRFCLAVGARLGAAGHVRPFALELRRGTWRRLAAPRLDPRSVSCASTRMCVAISGSSAARWNGRAWNLTRVIPRGANAPFLDAVACPGVRDCVAVGRQGKAGDGDAFGEIWRGRRWRVNSPANQCATEPGGGACGEFTISCPSTTFCMSAGAQQPAEDYYTGDANMWDGSGWANEDNPPPGASVASVSCPSASFCLGVDTGGPPNVTTWTGGMGWTDAGAPAGMTSVACPLPDECLAVGTDGGGQSWDGTTWSALSVPAPAGTASMRAIACPGPADCVAVGGYTAPGGRARVLADIWNGSGWSVSATPR
jgi:hypothetical protein